MQTLVYSATMIFSSQTIEVFGCDNSVRYTHLIFQMHLRWHLPHRGGHSRDEIAGNNLISFWLMTNLQNTCVHATLLIISILDPTTGPLNYLSKLGTVAVQNGYTQHGANLGQNLRTKSNIKQTYHQCWHRCWKICSQQSILLQFSFKDSRRR